ncbi:carbohydrate kinase [Rhizobium sp. S-51]|uniref:Carbohydrate kinase n=1 Tax=Rhizobium terricola TaxID=2728849 RepID=A0A7Y0FY08_9HYPH|nr:PfkB family carbohydrate kinase [Rhizobium terricola]NML76440.1 carbohydrate kinase [Rhizobium terricola]
MPASVAVIGHINHDRVWRLQEPLRSGARIVWTGRTVRLGGGGYYTGRMLLGLGHPVELVSSLMTDAHGLAALERLKEMGFRTEHVRLTEGQTEFAEIFLDPAGERTILGSTRRIARDFSLAEPITADAFYVNGARLSDTLLRSLEAAPLVVSQFPLRDPTPRPADVVVASRADFPGRTLADIWSAAVGVAGARLKDLMLTDGPNAMTLFDGRAETRISLKELVVTADTIGAGDSFSGAVLHELLNGASMQDAASAAGEYTADWLRRRDAGELDGLDGSPDAPA